MIASMSKDKASFLNFPSFSLPNSLTTMQPPFTSLFSPSDMGRCLLGQQYSKSSDSNRLSETSLVSKTDSPFMSTIFNVFNATQTYKSMKSTSSKMPLPSCDARSDLPPIRTVPSPSYFSGVISKAMERRSALSHCQDLSTSILDNCVNIMESLEETMEQSLSICPTKKGFLLKSDFRLDSTEVNFMTPECYEEIMSCSAKVASCRQSTFGGQKHQEDTSKGKESLDQKFSEPKITSVNKVETDIADMVEKVPTAGCDSETKDSCPDSTPPTTQMLINASETTTIEQCSNKCLTPMEPDLDRFTAPHQDDPDVNNNCDAPLQDPCQPIPDGFWDSDGDDDVFTDSSSDNDDDSSACSTDSFLSSDDDDASSSSDDDDEASLCAWDQIVNTRTPFTTHRKKNLPSRRQRRFSGDTVCGGSRRGSGKADSSYKRFEHREAAEILLSPCDDYESDNDDGDDSWFSVVEADTGETTPIIVRPFCVNSTISSIIGWHDSDNEESDNDSNESDHDDASSSWDDGDGVFADIPTFPCQDNDASAPMIQPHRQSKVRFCDTVEVHHMITWSYAYREARKGKWEQEARDRERFRQRIINTDNSIGWVLNQSHRDTVYRNLYEN